MFMKIQKIIIQQRIADVDVIADMEYNKKLSSIVTELLLSGIKLNISRVFTSKPYSKVLKL